MNTVNPLLTEVLDLESDLDKAQNVINRIQKTPIGKLPFVRSSLYERQIKLDYNRIRVNAAKTYLTSSQDHQ